MKIMNKMSDENLKENSKLEENNSTDFRLKSFFLSLTVGTWIIFLSTQVISFIFLYNKISIIDDKFSLENKHINNNINSLFNRISSLESDFLHVQSKNDILINFLIKNYFKDDKKQSNSSKMPEGPPIENIFPKINLNRKESKELTEKFTKFFSKRISGLEKDDLRSVGVGEIYENFDKSADDEPQVTYNSDRTYNKRFKRSSSATTYREGAEEVKFQLQESLNRGNGEETPWLPLTSKIPVSLYFFIFLDLIIWLITKLTLNRGHQSQII